MNLNVYMQAIADVISASPSGWHEDDIAASSGLQPDAAKGALARLVDLGLVSGAGCSRGFYRWVG